MKKITLLAALVCLSAMLVVAQTGASSAPSDPSASASSIQGCLSGSAGNYTLTDQAGKTYTITGDASKLADNVGKEVQLTGKSMDSSASASSASAAAPGASAGSAQFEASKVKKVSDSCTSGKAK